MNPSAEPLEPPARCCGRGATPAGPPAIGVRGAAAPALAGVIAGVLGYGAPYWIGCAGLLVAAGVLWVGRGHLARIDTHLSEEPLDEAAALTAADA